MHQVRRVTDVSVVSIGASVLGDFQGCVQVIDVHKLKVVQEKISPHLKCK